MNVKQNEKQSEKNTGKRLWKRLILIAFAAILLASGVFFPETEEEPTTTLGMILSFFRPTAVYAAGDVPDFIRVGLYYNTTARDSITVSCSQGLLIGTGSKNGFTQSYATEQTWITFSVQDGKIVGTDKNGAVVISDMGSDNAIWPASGGKVALYTTTSSYKLYRGGIILIASGTKLTVINLIGLEQYLYGVVNSEMYYTNPMEALKAQAVAARSYAVCQQNNHKTYGFDVCTTQHCQAYGGISAEKNETIQAVNETAGQVIRYNGSPVKAYYASNNGGWVMDPKDVWLSSSPYLIAKEDPYTPVYSWTATLTYEELAERINTKDKKVGEILSVEVTKTTDYGYAYELTITGTENTFVYTAEKIRTGFAASLIKSQNFTLIDNTKDVSLYLMQDASAGETDETAGTGETNETGETNATLAGASSTDLAMGTVEKAASSVYVLDGDGNLVESYSADLTIQNESLSVQLPTAADESGQKTVTLIGQGLGHGIGMSQDGAKEMARQGFTYIEILKFYYNGIEVY